MDNERRRAYLARYAPKREEDASISAEAAVAIVEEGVGVVVLPPRALDSSATQLDVVASMDALIVGLVRAGIGAKRVSGLRYGGWRAVRVQTGAFDVDVSCWCAGLFQPPPQFCSCA